jgi:hypothetical protein
VGAADWVQIFSYTDAVEIRCPIIDALIDFGVLSGEKWNLGTNPNALCLAPGAPWRSDPAFMTFAATTRWILDPADGENYASVYSGGHRSAMLQEVIDDAVVPNLAALSYGGLIGPQPGPAAVATSATPSPSTAAGTAGSQWIQYRTLPADTTTGFPGNTYAHGSLLAPADAAPDGVLGTAQMQTDALTYLVSHL